MFEMPSTQLMLGYLVIGLMNGAFYAMLSLGVAVIFGLMGVINFAHGALYTLGAFLAWMLLSWFGIGYWGALILAPLAVAIIGLVQEKLLLRKLNDLDPIYGLLLTYGFALIVEGILRNTFGSAGVPYNNPIPGGVDLGFMFLPAYRAWIVGCSMAVCLFTWLVIERTKLGSYVRAATENPDLVRAFGINVPRMVALTYTFGVAIAAFSGVLAAPIRSVDPQMGSHLIITVFAVVVIGGLGSIGGAIITGFGLGLLESVTNLVYPPASHTIIFVVMALVLLLRPAGLFGATQ